MIKVAYADFALFKEFVVSTRFTFFVHFGIILHCNNKTQNSNNTNIPESPERFYKSKSKFVAGFLKPFKVMVECFLSTLLQ